MRLREIQALLHQTASLLKPQATGQQIHSGQPGFNFHGLAIYREAVTELRTIDALRPLADTVLDLPVMRDGRDQVLFPQAEGNGFLATMEALRTSAAQLMSLLDQTVQAETETCAGVRLPEIATLSELQDIVGLLEEYFSLFNGLPVGDGDERIESVQLRGPDVGSFWLVIDMTSTGGLALLGLAVRYALDVALRYRRGVAEARLLEAAADDTADALKLNKVVRSRLRRAGAEKMRDAVAKKANNDETARMMAIVKHGERLISKRVEIIPSLLAKAEVREAFPPAVLPKRSPHELLLTEGDSEMAKLLTEGDDNYDHEDGTEKTPP